MSCVMMFKKTRRRIMLQRYNDKNTQQKRAQTTNRLTCTDDPLLTCTDEPRPPLKNKNTPRLHQMKVTPQAFVFWMNCKVSSNPKKKTWKLVSLARVWLGTNVNTGLGNEKKPPLPT